MKKSKFLKGLTLAAVIAVSSAMPTTAFAVQTIKVNGYLNEGIQHPQLEVSQIIKDLNMKTIYILEEYGEYELECDGSFIVSPSSVIKSLDMGSSLSINKIKKEANGYKIMEDVQLTEGQVQVYEETGNLSADGVMEMKETIISVKDFDQENYTEMPIYQAGAGAKLTQPGEYLIQFRYPAYAESTLIYIKVEGKVTPEKTQVPQFTPTSSKVLVNEKEIAFEAYNINNSNYFKLRDLAYVLNDSLSQCNITWDAEAQAVVIIPGVAYEVKGNELRPGDGKAKEGKETSLQVVKEGVAHTLKAYNIGGNNYVKVRDMEALLQMTVGYEQEQNRVTITTNK